MRARLAMVIVSCWTLATTAAHADEKIAIIGIEIAGDAAPELSSQLQRSIRGGLAAEGAQVVSLEDVQVKLRQTPELIGCVSTTCLSRIGELVEATQFVRARMDGSGAAYSIELTLLSAQSGDGVVKRVEESCTACTITELNELASKAAARLLRDEIAERVGVVIATDPAGANVLIDGNSVGKSPYTGTLAPGTYTVSCRLDGRAAAEKTITVLAGTSDAQNYELTLPPAASIDQGPEGQRSYSLWKWVAAGGAVVWIGAGIALIAIDGDQTCDRDSVVVPGQDPVQRQCAEIYDTKLSGLLSVGVGVGLGAASGYMFFKDHQASEAGPAASLSPTRGGGVATLRWKF